MKNYREISLKINEHLTDAAPETFLGKEISDKLVATALLFKDDIDRKITVDADPEKLKAISIDSDAIGANGQGIILIDNKEYLVNVNYERYTAEDDTDKLRLRQIEFKNGEYLRFEGNFAFFSEASDINDILLCERKEYPVFSSERAKELGIVEYDPNNPVIKGNDISDAPTEYKELSERNVFFEDAFDALKAFAVEGRKYDSDALRDSREAVLDCISRLPAREISFYGEKFTVNEVTTRIDNSLHLSESEYRIIIEMADGTFPGYQERITMSAETKDALKEIPGVSLIETKDGVKIEIDTERFVKTNDKGEVVLDKDGFDKVLDSVKSALEDYHYTAEIEDLTVSQVETREDLFKHDALLDEIEKEDTEEAEKLSAFFDLNNSGIEKYEDTFGNTKSEKINKAIVNIETGEFKFVYAYKTDDGLEYFKESENSPTYRLSENWKDVTDCFKGQNMKSGLFRAMEKAYKRELGITTDLFTPTEIESVSNLMTAADFFISKMSSEGSLTAARFMYETISNYVNPVEKVQLAFGEGGEGIGEAERLRNLELEGKLVEPTGKTIEQMIKDGTALEQFLRTGTRVEVAHDSLMDFVSIQSKDGGQSSKVGGTPLAQRVWAPITLGTKFIGYLIGNLIWRKYHHLEDTVSIKDCFKMAWASAPFLKLVDPTEYKKNRFSRTPNAIMQLELKKNLVREHDALRVFEKAAGIDYEDLVGVTKNKMSTIEILNESILFERGGGKNKDESIIKRYDATVLEIKSLEKDIKRLEGTIESSNPDNFKKEYEDTKKKLYKELEAIDKKKDKDGYAKKKKEIEKKLKELEPKTRLAKLEENKKELEPLKAKLEEAKKSRILEKWEKHKEAAKKMEIRALETKEKEDAVNGLKAELGYLETEKKNGNISEEEYNSKKTELEEKLSNARKELSTERNGTSVDNCKEFKEKAEESRSKTTFGSDFEKEKELEKAKLFDNLASGTAERPMDKVFKTLKTTIAKIEPNDANKAKLEAWKDVLKDISSRLTNSEKVAVAYDAKNELFKLFSDEDVALEYKIGGAFEEKDLVTQAIEIVKEYIQAIGLEKEGKTDEAKAKLAEIFGDESKFEILKTKLAELEAKENPTAGERKIASAIRNFVEYNANLIFAETKVGEKDYFESESELLAIQLENSFTSLEEDTTFENKISGANKRIEFIRENGAHGEIAKIDLNLETVKTCAKNQKLLFGDKETGSAGEVEVVKNYLKDKIKGIDANEFIKGLKKVTGVKEDDLLTIPNETAQAKQKAFISKNVAPEYVEEVSKRILELETLGSTYTSELTKVQEIAADLKVEKPSDIEAVADALNAERKEFLESTEYKSEESEVASELSYIDVVENARDGKEGVISNLELTAKEARLDYQFDAEQSKFVPYESSYLSVELIELEAISENSALEKIYNDLKLTEKVYGEEVGVDDRIPDKKSLAEMDARDVEKLYTGLVKDGTIERLDNRVDDVLTLCESVQKQEEALNKQIALFEKNSKAVERIKDQNFKKKNKSSLRDVAVNVTEKNSETINSSKELIKELREKVFEKADEILSELNDEITLLTLELENCKTRNGDSTSQETKILESKIELLESKRTKIEGFRENFELKLEKTEKAEVSSTPIERTVEKVLESFEKFKYKFKGDKEYHEVHFERTKDPKVFETSDKAFTLAIEGSEPLFDATVTVNSEVVVEGKEIVDDFTRSCELNQVKTLQVENMKLDEFTDIEKASEAEREAELVQKEDEAVVNPSEVPPAAPVEAETPASTEETPVTDAEEKKGDSIPEKETEPKPSTDEKPEDDKKDDDSGEDKKQKPNRRDKLTKVLENSIIEYVCKKRGVDVEGKFKKSVDAYYKDKIAHSKGFKKFGLEMFYKYNATPFAKTIDSIRRFFEVIKTLFTGKTEKAQDIKMGEVFADNYDTGAESSFYHQFLKGEHRSADGKNWEKATTKFQKKEAQIEYLLKSDNLFSRLLARFIERTDTEIHKARTETKLNKQIEELTKKLDGAKTEKQRAKIQNRIDALKSDVEKLKHLKTKFLNFEVYEYKLVPGEGKLENLSPELKERFLELCKKMDLDVTKMTDKAIELVNEKTRLEKTIVDKQKLENKLETLDKAIEKADNDADKKKLEKERNKIKNKIESLDKDIESIENKIEVLTKEYHDSAEEVADDLDTKLEGKDKVEQDENLEANPADTEPQQEVDTENPVSDDEPKQPERSSEVDTEQEPKTDDVDANKQPEQHPEDTPDKDNPVEDDADNIDDESEKKVDDKDVNKDTDKDVDNPGDQNPDRQPQRNERANPGEGENPGENPVNNPSELDTAKSDLSKMEGAARLDANPSRAVNPENGSFESADGMNVSQVYENATHLTRLDIEIPGMDNVTISFNAQLAPGEDGKTAREFFRKEDRIDEFDVKEIKADTIEDKIREVLSKVIETKDEKIMFDFNDEGKTLVDVTVKDKDGEIKKKKTIKLEDLEDVVNSENGIEQALDDLPEQMVSDLAEGAQEALQQGVLEIQSMGAEGAGMEEALGSELAGAGEEITAAQVEAAVEAAEAAVAAEAAEVGEAAAAALV